MTTWLGRLVCLFCLACQVPPALAQVAGLQAKPFVMAVDVDPHLLTYRWTLLIYQEAFRRMDATLEVANFPLARRTALVAAGAIDGELLRIFAYADTHPELVRVEEPVIEFTFSLYTALPKLQAQKLEDLPADALVEYRRGILVCENLLKKIIPTERLSNISSTEQGVKKLLSKRSDAYCDIDVYVDEVRRSGEIANVSNLRKLFDIAAVPTYPYFYKKHADLAPRLAAILKQMKAEGLIAAYLKQAEREAGAR